MSLFSFLHRKPEPPSFTCDLGTFTREKNFFHGDTDWLGQPVEIMLTPDAPEAETAEQALSMLRRVLADAAGWEERIRQAAVAQFAEQDGTFKIWGNDDEEPHTITQEAFLGRISLNFLHAEPDGSLFFDYDLDGMYTDHGFGVYANVSGEIESASLWG